MTGDEFDDELSMTRIFWRGATRLLVRLAVVSACAAVLGTLRYLSRGPDKSYDVFGYYVGNPVAADILPIWGVAIFYFIAVSLASAMTRATAGSR